MPNFWFIDTNNCCSQKRVFVGAIEVFWRDWKWTLSLWFKVGIAKGTTLLIIKWLEALIEICTFWQGNKFAPRTLVGIIQIVEKGAVNWVDWFSTRLQNEVGTIQNKARKQGNTLVGPTFTHVAHYYIR